MASVAACEIEVLTEKQRAGIEAARDPNTGKCGWGGPKVGTRITFTGEKETLAKKLKAEGQTIASISRNLGIARKTVSNAPLTRCGTRFPCPNGAISQSPGLVLQPWVEDK
jgi:hypothetical protein